MEGDFVLPGSPLREAPLPSKCSQEAAGAGNKVIQSKKRGRPSQSNLDDWGTISDFRRKEKEIVRILKQAFPGQYRSNIPVVVRIYAGLDSSDVSSKGSKPHVLYSTRVRGKVCLDKNGPRPNKQGAESARRDQSYFSLETSAEFTGVEQHDGKVITGRCDDFLRDFFRILVYVTLARRKQAHEGLVTHLRAFNPLRLSDLEINGFQAANTQHERDVILRAILDSGSRRTFDLLLDYNGKLVSIMKLLKGMQAETITGGQRDSVACGPASPATSSSAAEAFGVANTSLSAPPQRVGSNDISLPRVNVQNSAAQTLGGGLTGHPRWSPFAAFSPASGAIGDSGSESSDAVAGSPNADWTHNLGVFDDFQGNDFFSSQQRNTSFSPLVLPLTSPSITLNSPPTPDATFGQLVTNASAEASLASSEDFKLPSAKNQGAPRLSASSPVVGQALPAPASTQESSATASLIPAEEIIQWETARQRASGGGAVLDTEIENARNSIRNRITKVSGVDVRAVSDKQAAEGLPQGLQPNPNHVSTMRLMVQNSTLKRQVLSAEGQAVSLQHQLDALQYRAESLEKQNTMLEKEMGNYAMLFHVLSQECHKVMESFTQANVPMHPDAFTKLAQLTMSTSAAAGVFSKQ